MKYFLFPKLVLLICQISFAQKIPNTTENSSTVSDTLKHKKGWKEGPISEGQGYFSTVKGPCAKLEGPHTGSSGGVHKKKRRSAGKMAG